MDLDGTLLRSDLLIETGLVFLRDQPHRIFSVFRWLARGKSVLKHELANATDMDVSVLPYDRRVIDLIETQRQRGRRVVLATASHVRLADRVAAHLQLFDEVVATNRGRNLSAQAKRDALVQAYGVRGFDYLGNCADDLLVWGAARHAYVVSASPATERRAREIGNVVAVLNPELPSIRDWFKALRVHQWLKNLLVFVPLLAAHRYSEPRLLLDVLLAFASFCLCASSVYLLNDLLDLRNDRQHARKRSRAFASGRISIQSGLAVFPVLLIAAFGLALWQLPLAFTAGLGVYYGATLAYSLMLKRRMIVDVMTLAGLYTIRIIAGSIPLGIPLSFWLLAFSMFMFLSLALVKRYAELFQASIKGGTEKLGGRGYFPDDLPMIAALGAGAAYVAVMVLALYINETRTTQLYRNAEAIWLACPLLLTWISRVWMLAHRGQMNEDPLVFAVTDRVSLAIGLLMALVFWWAT